MMEVLNEVKLTEDEVKLTEEEEKKLTKAQKLAIKHNGSDLLISAGAGSGKTYTLTKKIVKDIIRGKDIANMLIVTFTKEAANKLKCDIREKLAEEFDNNPENKRLESQIIKASTADISTIDSFCYKLVKANFDKISLESGAQLDSNFRIGEGGELKVIEYEALDEVLDEFYEAKEIDKDFMIVSDCYSNLSNEDELKENLLKLYRSLINTKDSLETIKASADFKGDFMDSPYATPLLVALGDAVNYFKKTLNASLSIITGNASAEKKFLNSVVSDLSFIERLENGLKKPKYATLCDIFKSYSPIKISGKDPSDLDVSLVKSCRTELKVFVEGTKKEENGFRAIYFSSTNDDAIYSINQNAKMSNAIYKVLKAFDLRYEEKKALYSVCSFNDVSKYALKLLYKEDGSLTPLAEEIKGKYSYIYIDEYQDTNSVQDRIFSAISNNNRFMVGDIKQSIYNFRDAEPEIFSNYRKNFVDKELDCSDELQGRSLFMSENFRCNKEVIDFTNLVSNYAFGNSYGIPYVSKDDLKFSKTKGLSPIEQLVEVNLFTKPPQKPKEGCEDYDQKLEAYENGRVAQEEYVAKEIKRIIDEKTKSEGDKFKKSQIAILLRSTKDGKAQKYIDALKKYGVDSDVKLDVAFYEKPHVLLALSILNAIDNPYKDVFLAGAMRSQIFNFSLEDLLEIRSTSYDESKPLYTIVKEYKGEAYIEKRAKAMIEVLDELRGKIRKECAHDVVAYILNDMGLLSFCDKEQRQDLLKLYNIARVFEGNSFKGLYKFLRYIDSNMSSKVRSAVSGDDEESVRIMTIHASKGLEFEYCFVCDLEGQMNSAIQKPAILFNRELGVAGLVGKDNGLVKYNSLPRKCVDLACSRANLDEEMRMIYVALTRARTKLYVCASVPDPEKEVEEYRSKADYLSPYNVYKTSKRIGFILGALTEAKPFYKINYPNVVKEKPKNPVDNESDSPTPLNEELVQKYQLLLHNRINFKYRQEHLTTLPSKLSISSLKPNILDGTENETLDVDKSLDAMPKFLLRKGTTSATDRGTATHVFLQFCEFKRLKEMGFENELNTLCDKGFIPEEYKTLIDGDKIEDFVNNSELFDEILRAETAERIWREFRFNVKLSARNLSSEPLVQGEKVLIQGVIDCLFENENKDLILVDYKTDKLDPDGDFAAELLDRYRDQLTYYRRACKKLFGRRIKETLIYSVYLNKTVEVPFVEGEDEGDEDEKRPLARATK